jgi:hypothetical protein
MLSIVTQGIFDATKNPRAAVQQSRPLSEEFLSISCETCHATLQISNVSMRFLHARQNETPACVA